jgi:hypothetical protein
MLLLHKSFIDNLHVMVSTSNISPKHDKKEYYPL